jgi:hypothetical protein
MHTELDNVNRGLVLRMGAYRIDTREASSTAA